MDPSFWQRRWECNRIGFHQPDVNPFLQTYWSRLELDPRAKVFVPLCGKSVDLLWLRSLGHDVIGVEISQVAVESFFGENGLTARRERKGPFEVWRHGCVELYQGDFFDLEPDRLAGVAACYDRAALVAFPEAQRARYAERLHYVLPRTTRMLLITLEYPQGELEGPPFAVPEPEVRSLFEGRYHIELLDTCDLMQREPRWREAGLSSMREKVFQLSPAGF